VRSLLSTLAGAAATVLLTLLLAALAPRGEPAIARPAPVRPLLRAPEAPPAAEPVRPSRAVAREGGGGGAGMRGAARSGAPAARGAATPRAFAAPVLASAAAPRTGVVWPEPAAWPRDALSGVSFPVGDLLQAGAGPGRGGGGGQPAPPAPPVARVPGVTRRAIPQYAPQPAYPASMRAREESGFVEALIDVDATGAVSTVAITSSSGGPVLEDAVRSTVARWRFSPALRDGKPVATTLRRRFEFRMVDR
jgi:TonB family protein